MNTEEFRAKLAAAVDAGTFVPVLGAQVSTSLRWANSPDRVYWDALEQRRGRSVQQLEYDAVTETDCQVAASLFSGHWLPGERIEYGPTVETLSVPLARYLGRITGGITGAEDPEDVACKLPDDELGQMLTRLRTEVTALSFVLNLAWASSLAVSPRPLRARLADDKLDDEAVSCHIDQIKTALSTSLDACQALWNATAIEARLDEPALLKLEWVYEKLLVLASRALRDEPDAQDLWSGRFSPDRKATFARRHAEFVQDHGNGCGWRSSDAGAYPVIARPNACGLRASHVLWAEGLRLHCVLAGSRMYRTTEQIVFLLALDDAVDDLLNVTADPSEIGLVYREQLRRFEQRAIAHTADTLARDIRTLRMMYEYCGTLPDGSPRPPDALHRSLARLLAKGHEKRIGAADANAPASKRRPRSTASAAPTLCREVVLCMSMDLEMERAIEERFPRYRVLVPARVPADTLSLSANDATSAPPAEGDYWATWCLGQFDSRTSEGGRVAESWCWTDDVGGEAPEASAEGDGPLIVKLFGSPLHDLPAPARHRIVMDESDLLRLVHDLLPRSVTGLDDVVRHGQLYFFGQDAATWSERTPFYMMVRHHGEPQKGESREGDVRGQGDVIAAMDVGRLRVSGASAGASALRSLNISWPQAEELGEIAMSVVAEAYR